MVNFYFWCNFSDLNKYVLALNYPNNRSHILPTQNFWQSVKILSYSKWLGCKGRTISKFGFLHGHFYVGLLFTCTTALVCFIFSFVSSEKGGARNMEYKHAFILTGTVFKKSAVNVAVFILM